MSDSADSMVVRLLLADDEACVRDPLASLLGSAGFQVTSTKDGTEAIAALAAHRFDILVLDILMPGATGWEVLAQAVADTPPGRALPRAILITGFHHEYVVDMEALRSEGAAGMLFKPFPPKTLVEEVQRVLGMDPHYALPREAARAAAF